MTQRLGPYFVEENGEGVLTLWKDNPDFPDYPEAISADEDVIDFFCLAWEAASFGEGCVGCGGNDFDYLQNEEGDEWLVLWP